MRFQALQYKVWQNNCVMPKNKVLSLCIPTYNRSKYLDCLLSRIYEETMELGKHFEVCISDNHSTDDTASVVRKWEHKLPIKYKKNSSNVLFEANLLKAAMLANSDFIWFLGDDDLITNGVVAHVIRYLERARNSQVGSIYINSSQAIGDTLHYDFKGFKLFDIRKEKCPLLNLSFVGSVCVRRKIALEIISKKIAINGPIVIKKNMDPYFLYDCPHAFLFLECASKSGIIGVVPESCIRISTESRALSYEHRCYMATLLLLFSMDIRKEYSWCNDLTISNPHIPLKMISVLDFFLRASLVARRPALEKIHMATFNLYRRHLQYMGDTLLYHFCGMLEYFRNIQPFKELLIFSSSVAICILKINVTDKPDNSKIMENKMSMAISRAKKIF